MSQAFKKKKAQSKPKAKKKVIKKITKKKTAKRKKTELIRKVGRPSEYDPKICDKAYNYLNITKDKVLKKGVKVKLVSIEGLAIYLSIHRDTLYDWADKFPEFSDTLDMVRIVQKERLINSGLAGEYNSTIAKLMLSHNHGMAEKTEIKDTTEELDDEKYDKIIQREAEDLKKRNKKKTS